MDPNAQNPLNPTVPADPNAPVQAPVADQPVAPVGTPAPVEPPVASPPANPMPEPSMPEPVAPAEPAPQPMGGETPVAGTGTDTSGGTIPPAMPAV